MLRPRTVQEAIFKSDIDDQGRLLSVYQIVEWPDRARADQASCCWFQRAFLHSADRKEEMTMNSEDIRRKIAGLLHQPVTRVSDRQSLANLVADPIAFIEIIKEVEELFAIRLVEEDMRKLETVGDLTKSLRVKTRGLSDIDYLDPSVLAMYEIALADKASERDAA